MYAIRTYLICLAVAIPQCIFFHNSEWILRYGRDHHPLRLEPPTDALEPGIARNREGHDPEVLLGESAHRQSLIYLLSGRALDCAMED
jgi:hypothetical protein